MPNGQEEILMRYGKLLALSFVLGLGGAALTLPAQSAPLSGSQTAIAAAQPSDVITVQRRRGHRHYRHRHGHRHGHWHGGGVGAGIAAGIIGATAGAIIAGEAARRAPQCVYTHPYTGERYYAAC